MWMRRTTLGTRTATCIHCPTSRRSRSGKARTKRTPGRRLWRCPVDRTEEEWSRLPVPIRVGLISAVSPDTKTEIRRFGSAPWDKLPEELRILLAPELVPDTDASD